MLTHALPLLRCERSLADVSPPGAGGGSERRGGPPVLAAFLALIVRVLTPIQAISEERRPYSIFGQRFITTLIPLASASAAAASLRIPSCIQITCGRGLRVSASCTTPSAYSEARKISTMSMESGISDSCA